uniref:Uncharacterized protein MANES_04G000700 n=1 Tax=Rhizophora mucronata TaxID=61149 RepID=A0A2P2JKP6_RHIMU
MLQETQPAEIHIQLLLPITSQPSPMWRGCRRRWWRPGPRWHGLWRRSRRPCPPQRKSGRWFALEP